MKPDLRYATTPAHAESLSGSGMVAVGESRVPRDGGVAIVHRGFEEDERQLAETMQASKFNFHAVAKGGEPSPVPKTAPERWELISQEIQSITENISQLNIERFGHIDVTKNVKPLASLAKSYRTILAVVDAAHQTPDTAAAHTIYQRVTSQFNNPAGLKEICGQDRKQRASRLLPDSENTFLRLAQAVRQLDPAATPVIFMDNAGRDQLVDNLSNLWAGKGRSPVGQPLMGLGHAVYEEAVAFDNLWKNFEQKQQMTPAHEQTVEMGMD